MRLIDADALEKDLAKRWDVNDDTDFANKEVWRALREAPTIDAVQVVRCKDCKRCHRFANDSNSNMKSWCLKFSLSKRVNDDDFCAWGERKDNEID